MKATSFAVRLLGTLFVLSALLAGSACSADEGDVPKGANYYEGPMKPKGGGDPVSDQSKPGGASID